MQLDARTIAILCALIICLFGGYFDRMKGDKNA